MTTSWTMTAEFLALILILLLMLHFYEKDRVLTHNVKMYWTCLFLSELSIVVNILCVYILEPDSRAPHWFQMLLNTFYFLIIILLCSITAWYLFDKLLEHVYDPFCIRKASFIISGLFLLYMILLASNAETGVIFSIDADGAYHRGPLNYSGYGLMLIEIALLIFCYIRHHASVSRQMKKIILVMPPTTVALVVFQYFHPHILMNGMLIALVNLILFINFQNRKIEQDNMTDLGNRGSFFSEISLRLAGHQSFHAALIHFSQFQQVNLKYGYEKGNEFLYVIARSLEKSFPMGRVFRFSNVTFALICPPSEETAGDVLISRILDLFQDELFLGKQGYRMNPFIATLDYTGQAWTPALLIEYLEYTLNTARKNDPPVCIFTPALETQVIRRKYVTACLKKSIAAKRLEVWYQPVYDNLEKAFTSAEALIRMQDDNGIYIPPSEFIPLAEETGLIAAIGEIVLEQTAHFLGRFPDLPLQSISVNLSMPQFLSPELPAKVRSVLEAEQVPLHRLKIELTEEMIVSDMDFMLQTMKTMTGMGFSFYLDDFGIGYSNFSCMVQLPFEYIKLDKSLIDHLEGSSKALITLKALIGLFHSLDMKIIAEGIETEDQNRLLLELGADRIQGFYYARPMTQADLVLFLQEQKKRSSHDQDQSRG